MVQLLFFLLSVIFSGVNKHVTVNAIELPPRSVFVDPFQFSVLGANATFRESTFQGPFFNPTATDPPFFQIFDIAFLDVIGEQPTINEVAFNAPFAFAHEAPIYVAETEEVFFASNDGGPLGNSDINHNNQVGKISMKAVEDALSGVLTGTAVNVPITELDLPDTVQMTNGGTGTYKSNLILAAEGRGELPSSIVLVNPKPPHNATVLLDNYYGRQFNSLDDIKVHPSGKFYFTDAPFGFLKAVRPPPMMVNQVYVFDPDTRVVRVAATDFDKPNGIAFTADGKTAYVQPFVLIVCSTDSGASQHSLGDDQTRPATIYAFDVDPKSSVLQNRRVFVYDDAGIPDGLQVDSEGRVYAGCGDGVHVWNNNGDLLGKIFIGNVTANFVFAGDGRLVMLSETKIFVAHIAAKGNPPPFP
ncbi:hypothetical protein AMATHDRAFT_50207 [Amanita thiersii Skay4041]|uniref:SMP-30/Gluconolactonase/LRE-like region domain-containing protein n=1 Tax=Amanita thiersii Skay4041 TaxID=703135 RepID=A0A2A9NII1_9AGAR|nr:hypothetical protein AMATHDRAFT_50207 [Amanita thiersii Skay4041]